MGPDRGNDPRESLISRQVRGSRLHGVYVFAAHPRPVRRGAAVYLLVEVPIDEPPEREAFSFFAWRFSFSDLLAAVFELFEPPLSLLAMVASSRRRDPSDERTTLGSGEEGTPLGTSERRKGQE